MKNNTYVPVIGLEIHVELATKSKMFCGCPADHFGKIPNTQTCPVCLGLPGALPVPNIKAVEWTILLGLALKCGINKTSKFDRKHYFYPDLPKGYQISQYDEPFCTEGYLDTSQGKVGITRVHLEEDTGKLQHISIKGKKATLIDFNRSGVPLVEIVSEPDIKSAKHAKEYAQELQAIIRKLKISDCDMEKGSMRLEANVSLLQEFPISNFQFPINKNKKQIKKLPNYKVEVKNINSFRFLEKAINYEIERQLGILEKGEKVRQETRGWSEKEAKTVTQRYKETAADYRYFPEPDIPPMEFTRKYIESLRKKLPKLPDEIAKELVEKYKIRSDYAQIISIDEKLLYFANDAFRISKKMNVSTEKVASVIINQKVDISRIDPEKLITGIKKEKETKISDTSQLEVWIKKALNQNSGAVEDFKNGKVNAIMAIVGSVMKLSKGRANPTLVKEILLHKLK